MPVISSVAIAAIEMQDEDDDTDCAAEDESEDIKPTGKLTRFPSVCCLESVQITTDTIYQAVVSFSIIKSEEDGRKAKGNSRPGLRDLPPEIGLDVKDAMKPELIRSIATSNMPWDNPSSAIFQQAYDRSFPNYPATLEIKDQLCSSVRRRHPPAVEH